MSRRSYGFTVMRELQDAAQDQVRVEDEAVITNYLKEQQVEQQRSGFARGLVAMGEAFTTLEGMGVRPTHAGGVR